MLHFAFAVLAALPAPVVRDGFAPQPLEVTVDVNNEGVAMYDRGFAKCGSSTTTKAPAWSFTLAEPMNDLRLLVDAPAVLVGPDKRFVCMRGKPETFSTWPAGQYEVFLFSGASRLSATIRLDQPQRTIAQAKQAQQALPVLALPTPTTPNPLFVTVAVGPRFDNGSAGMGCARAAFEAKNERLAPLGQLHLAQQKRLKIEANGVVAFKANGACLDNLKDITLAAGDYSLWLRSNANATSTKQASSATTVELEIMDASLPMRFPDAKQAVHLGDGRAPQVFTVTSSDGARGPRTFCQQPRRTPSFVVDADADNVLLSVLEHETGEHVTFDVLALDDDFSGAGRGEAAGIGAADHADAREAASPMRCDLSGKVSFRRMHGRFAVFVKTTTPSTAVQLLSRRADVAPDLFWAPLPIPERLPIEQRVLDRYYPLLRTVGLSSTIHGQPTYENLEKFFLQSPLSLFVTVDADMGGVKRGEPLLLRTRGGGVVEASRADGQRFKVDARHLVDLQLPTTLPAFEKPKPATDLHEALVRAGDAEKPLVDAYAAAESKFNGCVGDWMEKHDPTWGKSDDLVYSNGDTLSQRKFRQGDAVCGRAKFDAAAKKVIADINASRLKNAAAYRKSLEARFSR
jgi:hypothetical protein